MSLVAYAASSDEESDYEEQEKQATQLEIVKPKLQQTATVSTNILETHPAQNGHISDEDDDYTPVDVQDSPETATKFTLSLPKPKNSTTSFDVAVDEVVAPAFAKLPMPKSAADSNKGVVEEEQDDEFLRKKAMPLEEKPKPAPPLTKSTVRITIPALKDFTDVDMDLSKKSKTRAVTTTKTCGLLSILPKAKSEQNFAKKALPAEITENTTSSQTSITKSPAFVPDTVKNRRPAYNTEGLDGLKQSSKKKNIAKPAEKTKLSLVDCSDSDSNEDDEKGATGDFFSLNTEEQLPDVSTNEINAMVAKRVAKIAEVTTKYLETKNAKKEETETESATDEDLRLAQKRYHDQQLNAEAMQALVGSSAKRRRKQGENIQIMDISSEQVLPNRDEWMRTALASSTAFQPTGVLVDEEPVAGTRRKHQITYLAHKAKANEAELQAMWSANRQNRRATQSKYGF